MFIRNGICKCRKYKHKDFVTPRINIEFFVKMNYSNENN
jgi:hypothetical protein